MARLREINCDLRHPMSLRHPVLRVLSQGQWNKTLLPDIYVCICMYKCVCTANPTWGDIFECCFKAQSSKLERLFCHISVKRDVGALSFELWKSFRKCHAKWDWLYIYIYMRHDVARTTLLQGQTNQTQLLCSDPLICITWHTHICDMTHLRTWHDPGMCDMPRFSWHDSFISVMHVRDIP